jgi:predicted DNA-binding antitoxin AbrB/MazE fold protein
MPLTVEATYENGVLKPAGPLPLQEHEKVRVTVQPLPVPTPGPADEADAFVRRSYGLLRWTGDRETLRHLAEDPEFDPQESA